MQVGTHAGNAEAFGIAYWRRRNAICTGSIAGPRRWSVIRSIWITGPVMPSPQHPPDKEGIKSLTRRLDRAAADLNPFLMVLAVGLIVLNLTLYIGMAAAGGASAASMRRPAATRTAVAYPTEAHFGR